MLQSSFNQPKLSYWVELEIKHATLQHTRNGTMIKRKREQTNVRLFFCQCNNCSCCVRFDTLVWLSFSVEDLTFFTITFSSSVRLGKLLDSKGLHNPKSESLMWPYRSSSKLSGLMSLKSRRNSHYLNKLNNDIQCNNCFKFWKNNLKSNLYEKKKTDKMQKMWIERKFLREQSKARMWIVSWYTKIWI